jgi:hypothetical protein
MHDDIIKDLVVAQGVENPDAATLQAVKTRLEGSYIDDVLDGRFDAPAVQPTPDGNTAQPSGTPVQSGGV